MGFGWNSRGVVIKMSAYTLVSCGRVPLALSFFLLLSAPGWAEPVKELLDRLEKQRAHAATIYHVTESKIHDGVSIRMSTTKMWEKRTDTLVKLRLATVTTTLDTKGKQIGKVEMLTVSDGKREWRQMPVGDKVMVFASALSNKRPLHNLRDALSRGKVRLKGREHIARQPCVVLEATDARKSGRYKATYWVSESYGVVLKSLVIQGDRSRTEVTTSEFTINEPIDDAKFSYSPPPDATVLDTNAIGKPSGEAAKP